MKKSEKPAPPASDLDLEFLDWTGMDYSSARISPETAFRLCEDYPRLLANALKGKPRPRPKESIPEFVL